MVAMKTRAQWGARAPRSRSTISTPVAENWLHHTAGSEAGAAGMRSIQNYHMDTKGWNDIGYSFVYDRDERTWYEARGWGVSGAHTYGRNSVSHGFCVMGNFDKESVDAAIIHDVAWILVQGHKAGHGPATLNGGHRDVRITSCPGNNLYNAINLINNKAAELLNPPATPEPEDKDWAYPEHANRLIEAGIYSQWTGPGYPIDTDNQSAYLDRLLTRSAGLVRIDGGSAVYHVAGEYLIPVTNPEQAKVIVKTAGGAPSEWQAYVTDITATEAGRFTRVGSGGLIGGGGAPAEHTHSEYELKGHTHSEVADHTHEGYSEEGHTHDLPDHTHPPVDHTHTLTFNID